MFQRTKPSKIYQDLVEQIENAILEGKLKPGDRLPSQRDLGRMFQTGRGTLREALRVLEQKGLIEIKLGVSGGAIVRDVNTEQISEGLGLLIRHQKVSLDEIAEFREGVESNVAQMAAKRACKEDVAELYAILTQAKTYLGEGSENWKVSDRLDHQLHNKIAKIAGNAVYISVLRMVHDNIYPYYEQAPLKELETMKKNYQDHCEIVEAIEKKESDRAGELIREHVRRFNRYMSKVTMPPGPSL